jgi:hypothetical protein
MHILLLLHQLVRQASSISGRIQSLHDASKCLEIEDPTGPSSLVILADCRRNNTQRWTDNSNMWQIAAANGNKCLQIRHAAENDSDEFANDLIEATACKYAGNGGANRFPEGFQRLVFVNHTIVWRGQSKILPANVTSRYCVELEAPFFGSPVYLQHCEEGNPSQLWIFVTDKGKEREQAWEELRFDGSGPLAR